VYCHLGFEYSDYPANYTTQGMLTLSKIYAVKAWGGFGIVCALALSRRPRLAGRPPLGQRPDATYVNQRVGWTAFLRHPIACLIPDGVGRSTSFPEGLPASRP
jgi:hypothetical protein